MDRNSCLRWFCFMLLIVNNISCTNYFVEDEMPKYTLNAIGKSFMMRLDNAPEAKQEWKTISQQGYVEVNEAVLLYGGGYGWHYVLPFVQDNEVTGLVIWQIMDIPKNETPSSGYLGKPILRMKKEIGEDWGAGSFLQTHSFQQWQEHGLKISKEILNIEFTWWEKLKNIIPMTRSSNSSFVCFYQLTFENYIDYKGHAVIVGMTEWDIQNTFMSVLNYFPVTLKDLQIEFLGDDCIMLYPCHKDVMKLFITQAEKRFKELHTNIWWTMIYEYGKYGIVNEEHFPSGGGGYGGGGGGGFNSERNYVLNNISNLWKSSNLSSDIEEALYKSFEKFTTQYEGFCKLIKFILDESMEIRIEMNPSKVPREGGMCYSLKDNKIYFVEVSQLYSDGLVEEIIHYSQYSIFAYDISKYGVRNVEFEAKMCIEMFLCACDDCDSKVNVYSGFEYDIDAIIMFESFKENFKMNNFKMSNTLWQQYHELGKIWNDPNYSNIKSYTESIYDETLDAYIIEYLF